MVLFTFLKFEYFFLKFKYQNGVKKDPLKFITLLILNNRQQCCFFIKF